MGGHKGVAGLGNQEIGQVCRGAEGPSQAYERCLGGGAGPEALEASPRSGVAVMLGEMPKVKRVGTSKRETIQPRFQVVPVASDCRASVEGRGNLGKLI